ncbi:MAG: UbiA family prenyltransferase [Thaumarchaeota archaeon]|nr:UbiA family prenyltransferase [Nitrososphaerota archaeon]MCL5318651.1 UbiA family prenyltransferase [Nitrososphaerota archaeon]
MVKKMLNIPLDNLSHPKYLKALFRRLSADASGYWYFVKSRTLVYTFASATCIAAIISVQGSVFLPLLLITTLGMYLASLGVYVYNDITDIGEDSINSVQRPLIAGKVTKSQAAKFVIAIWSASLLLQLFLTWVAAGMTLLYILLGILYSHPATHLKKLFPLKTVVTALGGAMASLVGGLAAGGITPQVLFAATVFFLFFFILGPLGDVGDLEGDRMQGRQTFPVVLGIKNTIRLILSVPVVITLLALLSYHYFNFNVISPILVGLISAVSFLILRPLTTRWEDKKYLKKTRNRIRPMHILLQAAILLSAI